MLWLITILCGAVSLVVWVAFIISNRRVLRLCREIPTAQPWYPVLGNTLTFACSLEKMIENLLRITEESLLKGQRAVCFWFGTYPLVMVTNPNDIRRILYHSMSRGREMEESSKDYSKYGLVTSPVDHWKITRRHLNLSFHPRNVEQLIPIFNSTSKRLVADLSGHSGGKYINLMPHSMSAALRAICTFLYGPRTLDLISAEHFYDLRHAVELAAELVAIRVPRPWLNNDTVFKIFYGRQVDFLKKAFGRIWEIAEAHSSRRDSYSEKGRGKLKDGHGMGEFSFQTILEEMRRLQEKYSGLTEQHIMEEMNSFFATGTDTISNAVSSCLLALAYFPPIQDKVHEEICSVLKDNDNEVSLDDLKQLTYLDQVINETLRFFIIVPFTTRSPAKDVDLGGYTLPANKTALLLLSAACLDPKYFPDPHKFDPERFSKRESSEEHFFLPFSAGPRKCIGKTYSMALMKVMIIHVVRKYNLSTDQDIHNLKKKFIVTMTCSDGYNVTLRERKR